MSNRAGPQAKSASISEGTRMKIEQGDSNRLGDCHRRCLGFIVVERFMFFPE